LRRSLRSVRALEKKAPKLSNWSGYFANLNHYPEEGFAAKENFVRHTVRELRPVSVLDIGCNNGHFSLIAAAEGAEVVSIDTDPQVVASTWKAARAARANILPLVVNIARPTPASGWRGEECGSFLERARGRFDLLLLLAVVHHLVVSERVPLPRVLDLVAELTRDAAVIEFVDASDEMFKKLVRGREELFEFYSREYFENALRGRFEITRSEQVTPTRSLYLVRKHR
jgi:SAM-dependent methyltransferase